MSFLGPSIPIQPTRLLAANITAYSATVQWVTPYLAYTQEQYTVNYGTTIDSLTLSTPVLSSGTVPSAFNVTYDIAMQDLTPNTVYYFQLHSMNTYGQTTSTIMTFTTAEAGKELISHCVYLLQLSSII